MLAEGLWYSNTRTKVEVLADERGFEPPGLLVANEAANLIRLGAATT
jgi:hypothetical protein